MKLPQILFIAVLSLSLNQTVFAQNFNGNYTIGTTLGSENYTTISGAVAALKAGTVSGDVVFSLGEEVFNESIDLSSLNNGSFNITFVGADKDSTIIHPLDSIAVDRSGISILNSHNVILKNLTLEMNDVSDVMVDYDYNETKGINISGSSNISLSNVVLNNSDRVFTETYSDYIASAISLVDADTISIDSCDLSGAGILIYLEDFEDVSISECDFSNAQSHIVQFSIKNKYSEGISIVGNTFSGPFPSERSASSIYLDADWQAVGGNGIISYSGSNILVKDNIIDSKTAAHDDGIHGIFVEGWKNAVIRNNNIENGSYGIRASGCDTATVDANEVYNSSNNALYFKLNGNSDVANNVFTSNNHPVITINTGNLRLVHNTLHGIDSLAALRVFGMSGDSLFILNNIFYVESNAESEVIVTDVVSDSIQIDYNLYSGNATTYTFLAYRLGATQGVGNSGLELYAASFNDWQTGQALYDQNSKSFEPVFAGLNDYHIEDTTYRFGTFIPDFATDIDGDNRPAQTGVDVGADQYDEGVITSVQNASSTNGLFVYPNITASTFTVHSKSRLKNVIARITSLDGRVLYTRSYDIFTSETFEIEASAGIYFFQLDVKGEQLFTERIIKN